MKMESGNEQFNREVSSAFSLISSFTDEVQGARVRTSDLSKLLRALGAQLPNTEAEMAPLVAIVDARSIGHFGVEQVRRFILRFIIIHRRHSVFCDERVRKLSDRGDFPVCFIISR